MHWQMIFSAKTLWGWDSSATYRSSSTSWLDGLRGVAAVQVFFFHFFGLHTFWGRPYGSSPENNSLHQTIFLRPIWAGGSGAVSVFFVISGYAITYKSFTLMRRGNFEDLYRSLCSSIFRRGFRLYLPVVILAIPMIFFIHMVDMRKGYLYENEVKDNVFLQIGHFIWQTDDHLNPFAYKDNDQKPNRYGYVPTSWTIPMEYYGSMVCYLMMMVLSRIAAFRIRMYINLATALYAIHRGSWWTSNFVVGMLLADWAVETKIQTIDLARSEDSRRWSKKIALFFSIFAFGWYLSGMPPESMIFDFAPVPKTGYQWLYRIIPPDWLFVWREPARWHWYWSGNLIFLGISQVPWLRGIFTTRFCQWLGKLSFALYLCHAIVISAMSDMLKGLFSQLTENAAALCWLEFSVITPTIIALSALVERYIDAPSVRFSRWLEDRVFDGQRKAESSDQARDRDQQEMVQLVHSA